MTQPTRILYVINALAAGGTERQLLYLLGGLNREQYEPMILTLYDETRFPYHYASELKALDVPILTLSHGAGAKARIDALRRYARLMWRLRPSIVQGCLHYANLITRAARPFCPPHLLLTSARAAYLPGELRSEARSYWLDDLLIVNSAHIQQQVEQGTRRPASKIRVIHNGIPLADFQAGGEVKLRETAFPDAPFVIGMVGRIARQKDHATLLKALHLARATFPAGLKLFFVGAVEEAETQGKIEQLIHSYGLEAVVQQFASTDSIAPYYHAADLIVLPSLYEGFPNVLLEAFAAGKPVIASDGADAIGVVEPDVNGWRFPTGDARALARLLTQAWQMSHDSLAKLGQQGQEKAQRFSVEAMVNQYTEIYAGRRRGNG